MQFLDQLIHIVKKQSIPLLCLWSAVALLLIGNIVFIVFSPAKEKTSPLETTSSESISWFTTTEEPSAKTSAFDGMPIGENAEESVLSVMIDNFVSARAQHSGIRSASIVYEALAEGGITRLMLIFPYQILPRVGPVRSAREYFVDFAEEYGGIYLHAGGAPSALDKLVASKRLYHFDEDELIKKPFYSFRDYRYSAPHNLFMDLSAVRLRAEENNWKLSDTKASFCFTDEISATNLTAQQIQITFSPDPLASSKVLFQYDEDEKNYKRFYQNTKLMPHTDQFDGLQVSPSNIIVQVAESFLIPGDDKERIELKHLGSGLALLYRNGTVTRGQWRKNSLEDITRYETDDGKSFCLQPGQTWIAVVDSEKMMTVQ